MAPACAASSAMNPRARWAASRSRVEMAEGNRASAENFNFIRDITPVAAIGSVPSIMVVHPSFPARTIPEFIAYARANPGKADMASEGIGSTGQLLGEMFKLMAGIASRIAHDDAHRPRRVGLRPRYARYRRQRRSARC